MINVSFRLAALKQPLLGPVAEITIRRGGNPIGFPAALQPTTDPSERAEEWSGGY